MSVITIRPQRITRRLPAALAAYTILSIPGFAVDFATQVHPIIASRCVPCHSGEKPPAGLLLTSRESALKGGTSGAAIQSGDGGHSLLIQKVSGQRGTTMPPVGAPLSSQEIATLKAWIDEGAVWPDSGKGNTAGDDAWISPIPPRQPAIPSGKEANPIDRFVGAYLQQNGIPFSAPVSDEVFAHRAYLDVWGVTPSAGQLEAFLKDSSPDKRERLVDALLTNHENYTGNWISWWNDLLRNDTGVDYLGDRKSITPWLEKALQTNMPYRQMVSSLLNPTAKDDPDGFLIGVNWRGTVNASQTAYMQAAQNTAQVFLGINLKCASCHDSFINKYKLRQSYGMAALFSPDPKLELVRCDVKQGTFVTPQVLYPELTSVAANASLAERHAAATSFFTDPRNGRVPRTIVNRYWSKLFGRGLVEPVDDMDSKPWDSDLLDWLASEFSAHGSDLQYLLRQILTSRAYQLPAVVSTEQKEKNYVFRGPAVRRLSAEQFSDTLSMITGEWGTLLEGTTAKRVRDWELKSSPLSIALGRPIRDQVFTTRDNRATTFQALELVNGSTLENRLRRGSLRMLGELPAAPENRFDSGKLTHGTVSFDVEIGGAERLWLLTRDAGAYDPSRTIAGWADVELSGPSGTKKLSELETLSKFQHRDLTADTVHLADGIITPLDSRLIFPIGGLGFTRIHGRVVMDDASRPSDIGGAARFFLFTAEPDTERLVKIEGNAPVPSLPRLESVNQTINELYLTLLSRKPTAAETQIAREFFIEPGTTSPALKPAALEDFVWSMLLHPGFQYVY